jgi:hypothetical protein
VGELRTTENFDLEIPHPSELGVKVLVKSMVKLSITPQKQNAVAICCAHPFFQLLPDFPRDSRDGAYAKPAATDAVPPDFAL